MTARRNRLASIAPDCANSDRTKQLLLYRRTAKRNNKGMCSATFQRGRWTILRFIIISIGAFVIFFILFAAIAYIRMVPKRAVMGPFVTPANAAQWRGDLRYLAAQIPARHKNAFHSITRASFDDLAANLESKIPRSRPH